MGAQVVRRAGAVLVAVAVLAALAGCGDDGTKASGPDSGSSTPSSTTTTVPADTSTTAVAPTSTIDPSSPVTLPIAVASKGDTLPDGTVFGYITTLIAGHDEIDGKFDLAELLTGDAATAAAKAAGEDEAYDDYFIRNDNTKLRTITVDPTVQVRDVDYGGDCCELHSVDIAQWAADRENAKETKTAVYLTTTNGVVTAITEVFFP